MIGRSLSPKPPTALNSEAGNGALPIQPTDFHPLMKSLFISCYFMAEIFSISWHLTDMISSCPAIHMGVLYVSPFLAAFSQTQAHFSQNMTQVCSNRKTVLSLSAVGLEMPVFPALTTRRRSSVLPFIRNRENIRQHF